MANKRPFEVVTWPCSEEFEKDQSVVRPAFNLLKGPKGPSGLKEIFYGIEVGTSNAYAFANWESVEAHTKFMEDQNAVLKFLGLLAATAKDGKITENMIHASWEEGAALACLNAPFVELKKISPKSGVEVQAIRGALDKYVAEVSSEAAAATYGHVTEEPEKLIVLVGSKGGTESVLDLGEMAEVEVIRVPSTQFSHL